MSHPKMEEAHRTVRRLVERYLSHRQEYHSAGYNEETARSDFINPFLEALGWDVANKEGLPEPYRTVIHEEVTEEGAPDYTLRVEGVRALFVEAKKPSRNLSTDKDAALQLRSYAWSHKLPLSVLTDFEELAIYATRSHEPKATDDARVAIYKYYTVDPDAPDDRNLLRAFEEIWNLLSYEAVKAGSLERVAKDTKSKRGTEPVDERLLKDIEGWRVALARNMAKRNGKLRADEINFAVQATIDRLLFLRIAEGRGIEEYQRLRAITNGKHVYDRLVELYRKADDRYNSGLFDFRTDELTPTVKVDDDVMAGIVESLYWPNCPYAFSALPAEILGNVYEQFLGRVIRLTAARHVKVEDKPEVKKAGGVYYTPEYIVRYIVSETVGKLCDGKSPEQLASLRILDPACGSGSFLIVAYQTLLDRHLAWYVEHRPEMHPKKVHKVGQGLWRLTTAAKRHILVNSIFGVDIDRQAVEVAKLSLLLKVLEGETGLTILQRPLFGERALPSLEQNIKCGNSLLQNADLGSLLVDDPTRWKRLSPFEWTQEFRNVFELGGFDVVVGNPPYLKIEHVLAEDRELLAKRYSSLHKRFDVYGLFVERALELVKEGGTVGFIVPSTLLNNLSFSLLRKHLMRGATIRRIVNLGGKVFRGVNNDTMVVLMNRGADGKSIEVVDLTTQGGRGARIDDAEVTTKLDVASVINDVPGHVLHIRRDQSSDSVFSQMLENSSGRLRDVCACFQGFVTGGNEAYIVTREQIAEEGLEAGACRPAVFGDEVARYEQPRQTYWVLYLTRDTDLSTYPKVERRLLPFKKQLSGKREVKLGRQPWYALHWPRKEVNFLRSHKILVQAIRNLSLERRVVAALDTAGLFADHTLNVLYLREGVAAGIEPVLGLVNSRLVNYWFSRRHVDINIKGVYLEDIPVPRTLGAPIADLVKRRLDPRVTAKEKVALETEIDRAVYAAFGLTSANITAVESAMRDVD